jgi:hypothetical protein
MDVLKQLFERHFRLPVERVQPLQRGSCRGVQPFTGLNSVAVMLGVGF